MTEELATAKREGISCIVDGGHPDMGRDVNFLREISKRSGLPIVLGGGFYTQPFYPKEISTMSEEQIVQAIVKQVDADPIGVFGEIGSWDLMTADERKVFRAIGKAHVQTNIPIFTHTGIPGIAAIEQLDLLEDAGVAVIGGPDFGVHGEGYLRLSYANSAENIRKAIARIADFLAAQKGQKRAAAG